MAEEQTATETVPTFKVFAGNLAFATTDETLKTFFATAAEVVDAHVVTRGNRSLGYGFVDFQSLEQAEKAVKELDKKDFEGRTINVEVAKPRVERGEGGERRRRRGGHRGGRGGYRRHEGQEGAAPAQAPEGEARAEGGEPRRGRGRGRGRGGFRGGHRGGHRAAAPATEGGEQQAVEGGEHAEAPRRGRGGRRGGFRGRAPFRGEGTEGENVENAEAAPRARRAPRPRRPAPENQTPSQTTLFIANLPYSLDEEGLLQIFQSYQPKQSRVARYRGRSKGFGFVELGSHEMQQKAATEIDNTEHQGRVLSVKVAVVDLSAPHPAENGEAPQAQ